MIQNYWYKKEYAQAISGIAILLMVAHHFFGFGSWLLPGVTWLSLGKMAGIEVERIIGCDCFPLARRRYMTVSEKYL